MTTTIWAVAAAVAGFFLRHLLASTSAPSTPAPAPVASPPGTLTIGHGALLSLLMSALNTPPPAPLQTPATTGNLAQQLEQLLSQFAAQANAAATPPPSSAVTAGS